MSIERTSLQELLALVPAAREVPEVSDVVSGADLVGAYARQTDELARIVEAAIAERDVQNAAERDVQNAAEVAALNRRHRRRRQTLQPLADALGEQHTQLDEAEFQVRREQDAPATGSTQED